MNMHYSSAANPHDDGLSPGETLLQVDNISLSFGGVKAIQDVSF